MIVEGPQEVRLDKWLWATRVYKTRSRAIAACQAGHVRVSGQSVKPAHRLRPGETFTVRIGELTRTIRVLAFPDRRVGPKLVSRYLEDLTLPSEYARAKARASESLVHRPKGLGRPTKRDRRLLELMGFVEPRG